MPLDAISPAKNLTATLHYLVRTSEKPARYVEEPPPGVPQWNGIDDPHEIRIEDARGREGEFTLDRNGFTLLTAPSQVQDFYSDEEVKRVYYPEVERLLAEVLGASRVFVFDHTVRNSAPTGARISRSACPFQTPHTTRTPKSMLSSRQQRSNRTRRSGATSGTNSSI